MERFISSLGRDDRDVDIEIEVKPRKRTRTLSQNAFYWQCLTIILERMRELGYPPEELDKERLHHFFNGMFNYYEILNENTGEVSKMPRSSRILDTKEFSEYFDHVKRWCSEWIEIDLPEPNTQLEIH